MNSGNKKTIINYLIPILPPLYAMILLFLQRAYFPTAEQILPANTFFLLINILFLLLNLIEFIMLVRRNYSRTFCTISILFVVLLAFEFNFHIGTIPSPLADFKEFLNGYGGMWTGLLLVELVYMLAVQYYEKRATSRSGVVNYIQEPTDDTAESSLQNDGTSHTGKSEGRRKTLPHESGNEISLFAKIVFAVYASGAIILPFMNWSHISDSRWISSIKEIDIFLYGASNVGENKSLQFLMYLIGLFVICVAVFIVFIFINYILVKFFSQNSNQNNFFEEYSTPIIILVVAGAIFLSIRTGSLESTGASSGEEPQMWDAVTHAINFIASTFSYILCIIVTIIALLVAFETIRLVLQQCVKRGSLLKGSMRLIFIIILQYTMGLLMGILRFFALRDVIESLILFFMPDLDDSVEPEVKRVFNTALRHEVHQVSKEVKSSSSYKQPRNIRKIYTVRYKRRIH